MSVSPAPQAHWGRDDTETIDGRGMSGGTEYEPRAGKLDGDLILKEQSRALPAALKGGGGENADDFEAQVKAATGQDCEEILRTLTEVERQSVTYLVAHVNPGRERTHKAYRNEHFAKSKYHDKRYDTRSKLFKPKTRMATRKAQAAAAGALFASADVVSVEAGNYASNRQRASAALKQELLNLRLARTSDMRDSIAWFLVSMGAHQDALLDGVCVSKQYWKYQEWEDEDEPTGSFVEFDRPDLINIPPENVRFDPQCEWTRPAQTSAYFMVYYPMPVHEVLDLMRPNPLQPTTWIDIPEDELCQIAGGTPTEIQSMRSARSGGADAELTGTGKFRILWVRENFLKIRGQDYTFWSIGNQRLLSVPQLTRKAHPALRGARPYTVGFGAIETHRPIPMAPGESWQQLQQEANDITNLRLDLYKQIVSPITKVARGKQVDMDQVMRRGQDTVLMVNSMDDVEFDRPPEAGGAAMAEQSFNNNDFDELAGTFSQSSVQSNRQLNETVGGMRMMQGGANSVTEYDLRVWIETWVEPVLSDLVRLEGFYESDERILTIAGEKAELQKNFGVMEITESLLLEDVTVKVSAGIGAADPMQSLEKINVATQGAGNILMPFIEQGKVQIIPKAKEIIDHFYGKAGEKNASERFFVIKSAEEVEQMLANQPQGDPAAMMKAENDKLRAENDRMKTEIAAEKLRLDAKKVEGDMRLKATDIDKKDAQVHRKLDIETQKANVDASTKRAGVEVQAAGHGLNVAKTDRELTLKERQQAAAEQQGALDRQDQREERAYQHQDGDRRFAHEVQRGEREFQHKDREHSFKRGESLHQRVAGAEERQTQRHHADRDFGRKVEVEDRTFKRQEKTEDRSFQHQREMDREGVKTQREALKAKAKQGQQKAAPKKK